MGFHGVISLIRFFQRVLVSTLVVVFINIFIKPVGASIDPRLNWVTLTTTHFDVIFPENHESVGETLC